VALYLSPPHQRCLQGVDRGKFAFFHPLGKTLSPRVLSFIWPDPRNPGQEHSVTLKPAEPEVFIKMYSSPLRRAHYSLFCIALYGTDGIPDDDPALVDVSGAVRSVLIIGGTTGLLLLAATDSSNKQRLKISSISSSV